MKLHYFKNIRTLAVLKERYHELLFKHHSDRNGGDDETTKAINAEYAEVYERIMNRLENKVVKSHNTPPSPNPESEPGKASFKDTLKNEVNENRSAIVDGITDLAGTLTNTVLKAVNSYLKKK